MFVLLVVTATKQHYLRFMNIQRIILSNRLSVMKLQAKTIFTSARERYFCIFMDIRKSLN